MQDDNDTLKINYGPAKRAVSTMGRGFSLGAIVAGLGLIQFVGVMVAFAFAALIYWLSDLAYDVSWVIGFPLRIMAVFAGLGALFALIGAVFKILAVVVYALVQLAQSAFGTSRNA